MNAPRHGLRIERQFDAPREAVFRAWTEQLACWYVFNDQDQIVAVEADVRIGGKYRVTWKAPDGSLWHEFGVYREIDPPRRLVVTCNLDFPDLDEGETVVTLELHERNGGTHLVLVQEGFTNPTNRDNCQNGWPAFLDKLAQHLGAVEGSPQT